MRGTSPPGRVTRRRGLRIAGLVVVLAVAVITLWNNSPNLGQTLNTLKSAHVGWLVLAAAAELTSLRHFALQQRRLLAGFGVAMTVPRAFAVTFSRTAISFSLPAGSAVSAGFAFRQFRTAGASRRTAGAVTVLSGVLSGVALFLMYGAVVLVPKGSADGTTATLTMVITLWIIAGLVFAADFWFSRGPHAGPLHPELADDEDEPPADGRVARLRASIRRTIASLQMLPPRSWVLSLVHATVNWALDFACLAATAAAFDIDVSLLRLATVYLTVQLVRQIPLSPGGIGVVEVALLAGLVSAGAPHGPAAAAMLVYRLLSCWIIIPIGGLAYAALRRGQPAEPPAEKPHVVVGPVSS